VLARQVATLDQVSNGRVTLGVGLGYPTEEYSTFGEVTGERTRAYMLDEGLAVFSGLLSEEAFAFKGDHYHIEPRTFLPRPVQAKLPIWVAGTWPNERPMRRAARWHGAFPIRAEPTPLTPDEAREIVAYVRAHRSSYEPFDFILRGETDARSLFALRHPLVEYTAAEITWWLETLADWRGTVGAIRKYVRGGPPTQSCAR
jgi:alkanesulfonate monooxygenase SsuD/methylene tetrahydromethanopterin reductase-like flavin-dependent oxidoreductase (luciferase family)